MSIYSCPEALLQDAAHKNLIVFTVITTYIGNTIDIKNSINVIDEFNWQQFLNTIITKSNCKEEIEAAKIFLHHSKINKQNNKPIISIEDTVNFAIDINRCNTIDDVFKLLNIQTPINIKWKSPVKINDSKRYYSYNTNWYIEKKTLNNLNYYSINNPDGCEVARYSKLKDAKNDAPKIINQFSDKL